MESQQYFLLKQFLKAKYDTIKSLISSFLETSRLKSVSSFDPALYVL